MSINAGPSSAPILEERLSVACTEECARFRTGNVSRADATVRIVSLLLESKTCQGEQYTNTLRTYLAILDKHEEELRNSVQAGSGSVLPAPEHPGRNEQLEPEPDRIDVPETSNVQLGKRTRKSRGDSFSDGEDSEHGFDERDLPWFVSDKTKEAQLPFNLQETRRLAIRYATHPKRTKLSLLQSLDRPEFPESEWDNLLRNRSIDIDRVLTHFTFARNDEPVEFQAGSTRFRTTDSPILKIVSDHGTWMETWSRVISATSHLYPHRQNELTEYQTFISRTFLACRDNPARVLLYDAAVRARVAAREIFYSPTMSSSKISSSPISRMGMESLTSLNEDAESQPSPTSNNPMGSEDTIFATSSTPATVCTATTHAGIDMCAEHAGNPGIVKEMPVARRRPTEGIMRNYTRPRFLRGLIWDNYEQPFSSVISSSELLPPVPSPPYNELNNVIALDTINKNPNLFEIVTPIRVEVFEQLLHQHPNRQLVLSVCRALREGFWPWANTDKVDYPASWDNSRRVIREERHKQFLRSQRDDEIRLGQFSESFGSELLPGMYSMPVDVVPKPNTDGLRLVNDFSAGKFSLNSMVPRSEASVRLDGVQPFAAAIRQTHVTAVSGTQGGFSISVY